tara:strand:+ start:284 stop:748 length:465 start_codon:yes stop_codon:yes gene_type:complete
MGRRKYAEFTSPESDIYRNIVDTLKNDEDLNRIKWYYYDFDNDDDIQDEVPPDGKIPALRIEAAEAELTEYSTDREDSVLSLDIVAWIDGNHVEDAWGVRNSIYKSLMLHRVPSVFSAPWVMGVEPGEIEQVTRGLMRSVQVAKISYFIEHPRR